jgi:hypothetical protein
MTFKEKIYKIVRLNKLGINSPSGLETYIKAGTGSITKYLKKDEEPGEDTVKKILELSGLNKQWWETGEEPVFIEKDDTNNTSVQNGSDNKGKSSGEADLYKKIVEGGTEYLLVPRTAFEGHHRFTSIEQINAQTQELKDKQDTIVSLTAIINDLLSGRVPQLSKIQETQKNTGI